YQPVRENDHWRVSIAGAEQEDISRYHALIEPLDGDHVRITNISAVQVIHFEDRAIPPKSQPVELALPAALMLGNRTVRIESAAQDSGSFQSLAQATVPPGESRPGPAGSLVILQLVDLEAVVEWLQATMTVLQSAASSSDFFDRAARAA